MSSDTTKPAVETRPAFGSVFIRRKSIEQMQKEYEGGELKRSLGAWNLILVGINNEGLSP